MQIKFWKKGLVVGIILLFVGASFVQGIFNNSKIIDRTSSENIIIDDWWDTQWRYRKQITINHTMVNDNLENFPILVYHISSDFTDNAQIDGDDFVFIYDENLILNHEIEYYNSSEGELVAWVNISYLSSTEDTTIWIYYGNPDCSNQESVPDTWSNHYVAVYHMNDLSTTTIADSTGNNNHGLKANFSLEADGKIGKAQDFERDNNQYIVVPDDSSLDLNGSYTHEHWINIETLGDHGMILYKGGYYGDSFIDYSCSFHMDHQYSSQSWDLTHNPLCYTGLETITSDNTWYYTATTSDKGQTDGYKAFLNGTIKDMDDEDTTTTSNEYDLQIGRRTGLNQLFFDGLIDEIRISDIPRSEEWINASFNNQDNPNSFMSFEKQEFYNNPPDTPSNPIPPNGSTVGIISGLCWTCEDPDEDNVYYDVYFGNTSPPPKIFSNISVNCTDLGTLEFNITYYWKIVATDEYRASTEGPIWNFETKENQPPESPTIDGPNSGIQKTEYIYVLNAVDPEGDDVRFHVNWGDKKSDIYGLNPSGEDFIAKHTWAKKGKYIIKARAIDKYDKASDWTILEVTMPKIKPFNSNFNLLNWLFKQFPNVFPILKYILG